MSDSIYVFKRGQYTASRARCFGFLNAEVPDVDLLKNVFFTLFKGYHNSIAFDD